MAPPAEPTQTHPDAAAASSNKDHYFTPYLEHSKTLRTWFVAYGVGGPILFATQKALIEKFIDYGGMKRVVLLLLAGTLLQILSTWMAKLTTYQFYLSELDPGHANTWLHQKSLKLSHHYYWFLPIVDFLTVSLFAWATVLVFLAWS